MKMPKGYKIIFLTASTACFWINDKGEYGATHRWATSRQYVLDCQAEAAAHAAQG